METSPNNPEYVRKLKSRIQEEFVSFIKPSNVLTVFHKYNENILVKRDIEYVEAQKNMKGDTMGATKLLDRLCLYDGWFECLIKVLRDREVRLDHVADTMENKKELLDTKIKEEKEDLVEIVETLQQALKMQQETIDELKVICNTRAVIIDNMETEIKAKDAVISDLMRKREDLYLRIDDLKLKMNKDNKASSNRMQLIGLSEVQSSFHYLAQTGQGKNLKIMLDQGVDVNEVYLDKTTALMYAARNGHLDCVNLLISYKTHLDMKDKYGDTAVAHAVLGGKDKCLTALIHAGAEIDIPNDDWCTPLMHAAMCVGDCIKCLKLLMSAGADIQIGDLDGDNAMFYAARYGNFACLKQLITFYGTKYVNEANIFSQTPLMTACASRSCSFPCVKLLLGSDANIHAQNNDGKTALDLAARAENKACIGILLRFGGQFSSCDDIGGEMFV